LSGTNFIMMTIMILILLFVLVNVGPLLGLYFEPAPPPGGNEDVGGKPLWRTAVDARRFRFGSST